MSDAPRLALVAVSGAQLARVKDDRTLFSRAIDAELPDEWPHADLADALDVLVGAATGSEPTFFVIVERTGRPEGFPGRLVGDIGFHGAPNDAGEIEIGYSVVERDRRRGIAGWAIAALAEKTWSRPDVRALVAECAADNLGSVRALERAGFARVPATTDAIRWRLEHERAANVTGRASSR